MTFYTREDVKYLKVIANVIAASQKKPARTRNNVTGDDHSDLQFGTEVEGLPPWLLASLPDLTKSDRKDLKTRGVTVRRGVKESDGKTERRVKAKNKIGTQSGYERRLEAKKKGAIEGSKRRTRKEVKVVRPRKDPYQGDVVEEEFRGFD